MKSSRFTETQILEILKEQETGAKVMAICRKHSISDATFLSWKKKFSGMTVSDLKRLRELEAENARLRKLVSNLSLDLDMTKDLLGKKF